MSNVDDIIKEAVEKYLEDQTVDLVSDMVQDNPDWWAEQVSTVIQPALKKAIKDSAERLLTPILKELVGEVIDVASLEDRANDIAESAVKDLLQGKLKVSVEVQQ